MRDTSCANHVISILEVGRYFSNLQNLTFKNGNFWNELQKLLNHLDGVWLFSNREDAFMCKNHVISILRITRIKLMILILDFQKHVLCIALQVFYWTPQKITKSTTNFDVCQVNFWRLLTKRQSKWGYFFKFLWPF